jgi:hypothetical protein
MANTFATPGQAQPQQSPYASSQQYGQAAIPMPTFQFRGTDWTGRQYSDPSAMAAQQGAMAQALNQQRAQGMERQQFGRLNPLAAYESAQQMVQDGWRNPFASQPQALPALQQQSFPQQYQPNPQAGMAQQAPGLGRRPVTPDEFSAIKNRLSRDRRPDVDDFRTYEDYLANFRPQQSPAQQQQELLTGQQASAAWASLPPELQQQINYNQQFARQPQRLTRSMDDYSPPPDPRGRDLRNDVMWGVVPRQAAQERRETLRPNEQRRGGPGIYTGGYREQEAAHRERAAAERAMYTGSVSGPPATQRPSNINPRTPQRVFEQREAQQMQRYASEARRRTATQNRARTNMNRARQQTLAATQRRR